LKAYTEEYGELRKQILTSVSVVEGYDSKTGSPPTTQKGFTALWDTGASQTAVTPDVANSLKLVPDGYAHCHVPGGETVNTVTYTVAITLLNKEELDSISVVQLGLLEDFDVLIGMDIITKGDFAVTSEEGRTCFSFRTPPQRKIDFRRDVSRKKDPAKKGPSRKRVSKKRR